MNKQFKELYQQAATEVQHDLETVPRDHAVMEHEHHGMINERFGELILTKVILTIYRSEIGDKKQERLVEELGHIFGLDK